MSSHYRVFLALVISQAACLFAGLWIRDRLSEETTRWLAHEKARNVPAADAAPNTPESAVGTDAGLSAAHSWSLFGITFAMTCGLQSTAAFLLLCHFRGEESKHRKHLEEEAHHQVKQLVKTRDAVIFGLAKLAESRDPETGQHLERISLYSTRFATALRRHPKYRSRISAAFVRSIGISSALHDIGKVGVEDSILLKPGKLTPQERQRIKVHPTIGGDCIREIELRLGKSNFLEMAREITLCHHERWDGEGYPAGLAGEEIPLAARIVAIVDVYDALSSRRVYKEPLPHDRCVEIIAEGAGTQFDPALVTVFLEIEHDLRRIADRFLVVDSTTESTDDSQLSGDLSSSLTAASC